ncbi:hypothetical protein MKW98_027453 [Papaver atlanticum]|uniref:Uncharacterized protein n=2 Tax=Papaver TaxID=3468 RepID=A0A4Y7JJH9_PAPSO|nr:hypothetical protein MKW92_051750 [Papaver armeniacum]KAI3956139.1 hypothetical protein MKW98_027453 [Papaver atlanticum]RZC59948.1 hypothetical protein C5167_021714 [Papaver somniferum]
MFSKKSPVDKAADQVSNAAHSLSKAAQPKQENVFQQAGTTMMNTAQGAADTVTKTTQDAVKTVKKTVGMK